MSTLRRLHFRTALAQVRSKPGRVASTVLAVAVGVALSGSILLVGEEIPAAIQASIQAVVGRANLQVVGRSAAGIDEELLSRVAALPGVAVVAPVVNVPSYFDDSEARQVAIWGLDLLNESALELYGMDAGGGVELADPLVFASKVDSVIAPSNLPGPRRIALDEVLDIVTPAGTRSLVVRGLLRDKGTSAGPHGILVMDVYSAQVLFDLEGRFTHLDVLLVEGVDLEHVRAEIAAVVGDGADVVPVGTHNTAARSMMAGAQLVIRGLSLCGIVLAVLVTFNRLSTVFRARQWEVGVSRAIGASPRLAMLELLKEAALIGAIGSVLGIVVAGFVSAAVAPKLIDVAEITLGTSLPKLDVPLRVGPLAIGALLGIAATVLGALLPARDAARAPVATVLRGRGLDAPASESTRARWMPSVLLACLSVTLLWFEARTHAAVPGFAALVALVLLATVAVRPIVALLLAPLSGILGWISGPIGRLAVRDLRVSLARASGSVRLLAIGLGIVLFFDVVLGSFEETNSDVMGGSRRADLIVGSAYDVGSDMSPLSEDLLDALRKVPGVAVVGGERALFGADFGLTALDAAQLRDPRMKAWTGDDGLAADAVERVAASEAVLVTPGFAVHHGVVVGDEVTLPTPSGPLRLPVAGLAKASLYSSKGDVLIARETYRRHWKDAAITRAHVVVVDGESSAAVRGRILRDLGGERRLRVFTPAELKSYYQDVVRRGAVMLWPMSVLTLVVVVLGIADSFLATVLEHTREIATMRALGASPGVVSRFVLAQSLAVAIVGSALAPAVALALGFAFLKVTSMSVLGWEQDLRIDTGWARLLAVGLLAVLAGVVLPTWRATRLAPAQALRAE